MMDTLNIEKSIISISSPGVYLKPGFGSSAVDLARRCNAFAADLKRRRPDRFGFFAVTPLPMVQEALDEIDKAFAEGADGVGLETNHEGIYLGDSRFDPIFAELDKRKAKVFIHPTMPCFCAAGTHGAGTGDAIAANPLKERFPAPVMEFLFDTARCVANLFLGGTVSRYPNITYLIPHMGGTMPPLFSRFIGFSKLVPGQDHETWDEEDAVNVLNHRFYFDMAGWSFPVMYKGLLDGVGIGKDRLLYGSDYPFTKASAVANFLAVMDGEKGTKEWPEEDVENAYYLNAKRLFGT
jgi:predicted TIM-barrel fold metal-dependent hydrolase